MKNQWKVPVNVGAVVLVTLVGAVAASAQINDFEKRLTASQGSMSAVGQRVAGTQCTSLCSECFWLDTFASPDPAGGNLIAHSAARLDNGALYLITIKGTYSVWAASWYVSPGQGFPENAPMFPTLGVVNGHAYADWEWIFGWFTPPNPSDPSTTIPLPAPLPFQGISVDGGSTYTQPDPIGGDGYNPAHVYRYLVVGQGLQAFFKKNDVPTYDNQGKFRICVQKLTPCGDLTGMAVSQ
ncbi:MAG: hypothetical protein EPN53_04785 [Acidobacteria bacterium]|nr:MAG: hypothetical protein EPN53_04785 [Acidobacteriota bacterium]